MPKPNLTADELIEWIDARLKTIENILSATVPGFSTDLYGCAASEIEASTTLNATQKAKIKTELLELQTKFKPKQNNLMSK